jgi:exosortase/archaeosortase family protein
MGTGSNREGVAGVSWEAKILPVRIGFSEVQNGPWQTTWQMIEDGIKKAVDRGADVLNGSWHSDSEEIISAIDYAISKGRVLVFSAGNDGSMDVSFPADLSATRPLIAVSATNQWDEFKGPQTQDLETWGSNYGPEVSLSAPGVGIYTTDIQGVGGYNTDAVNGNYVANFNGTSASAPFVTGVAALLLGKYPNTVPGCIRDWMQRGAFDLEPEGFDIWFGHGRLDAGKSMEIAISAGGICIALAVDRPAARLGKGEEKWVHATVTRNGLPLAGTAVSFSSSDDSRATMWPKTSEFSDITVVPTNALGVASARVRAETRRRKTVDVTATVGSAAGTKPVKVPVPPFLCILLLLAKFRATRKAAPPESLPSRIAQRLPFLLLIATFTLFALNDGYGILNLGSLLQPIVGMTAGMVTTALDWLQFAIVRSENIISVPGVFAYEIDHRCAGIWTALIVGTCILGNQTVSRRSRIAMLTQTLLLLWILNILRLVNLFWFGVAMPNLFAVMHEVIWPSIFMLLITALVISTFKGRNRIWIRPLFRKEGTEFGSDPFFGPLFRSFSKCHYEGP